MVDVTAWLLCVLGLNGGHFYDDHETVGLDCKWCGKRKLMVRTPRPIVHGKVAARRRAFPVRHRSITVAPSVDATK